MRTPLSFLAASLLAFLVCSLTNGINRAKAFAAGANGQSEANVSGKLSGKPESAHTAVPADQPLYDAEADDENPIDAALRKQKAAPDLRRYTIANITAPIPPDKDHDQALQLEYFVPAITRGDSPRGATFFGSVHGAPVVCRYGKPPATPISCSCLRRPLMTKAHNSICRRCSPLTP